MKVIAYIAKPIELEIDDKFKSLLDEYDWDIANKLAEAIFNQNSEIVEVLSVWDETNTKQLT